MELTRIRLAIFLLVLAQRCYGDQETEIKWDRCVAPLGATREETICYAPFKCKQAGRTELKFPRIEYEVDLKYGDTPGRCDTGVQIKPIGKSKWLVYMQVEESNLVLEEGVWIEAGTVKYGCKKNGNGIEYFGDKKLRKEKYPKAQETSSGNRIFCAFIISGIGDTLDTILRISNNFEFKFKKPEQQIYVSGTAHRTLLDSVKGIKTCDPEDATFDAGYKNEDVIRQKIEITEPKDNKCPQGNLFVKDQTSTHYVESSDIECVESGTDYVFQYLPKTDPSAPVKISVGTPFHVHCATKACTLCKTIDATGMTDTGIPYTGGTTAEECLTATCPETKDNWQYADVNGNIETLVTTVACEKKNEYEAAWFIKAKNGEKVGVKTAWCSKEFDCASMNPLKYECMSIKPKDMICIPPNKTAPYCDDGFLRTQKSGDDKPDEVKNIVCNHDTGTWRKNNASGVEIQKDTYVFCAEVKLAPASAKIEWYIAGIGGLLFVILAIVGVVVAVYIRRARKYSPSDREMRKRPRKKKCCLIAAIQRLCPEKLIVDDLAILKEWTDDMFATILEQWLKFSVYERYKFAERIGFELGVTTNCGQFFTLFTRIFEIETDYRVWQHIVPVFKLLHAQAADKENNLDIDKRMRKWCISQCKPIIERVGWDGCNNEFRETAYVRYIVFNLMYYCEDKDFSEKLLEFFDKGGFHGLHSINRQIAWAAAIREKDKFDVAKKVAEEAFCDKNAKKEIEARKAAKMAASSGGWTKTKSNAVSDVSGASSKSNKGAGGSAKDKKGAKGGSKESKSNSKDASKSGKSNRSNKSGKSKEEVKKKGSKETPSGKAKKGDSKEASKSDKSGKSGKSVKDKKKGGSKEAGKAKPRDKAGADEIKGDSGKEQKTAPASDKDKKKDKSGKDKKDKSNKSNKSGKDKKTTSGKDKKTTSGKEKTAEASKSGKEKTAEASKSGKSSKDKKDGSKKSLKDIKTVTAIDKSSKSKKSMKSTKTTKSMKKKKRGVAIGYKERKDADGDKLHGDRAQHIFFAIGSSRSKEQIASFLDWYIEGNEYDPSNLVYLFAATLEWDDTRSYGLDLFLNMNKKAFIKMPPGHKYHMRILKNFKKYVIGELDLQKLQSHIVNDPNYSAKNFSTIDLSLMLKRIHNNVTFQPQLIEDLDKALKKLNF